MEYTLTKPILTISKAELKTIYSFVEILNKFSQDSTEDFSLWDIVGEIETVYEKTKYGNNYFSYVDNIFNYNITD